MKLQRYETPGTPGLNMTLNSDPQNDLNKQAHKDYRSGVGMLLWLVKHSRPDIDNSLN